MHPSELSIADFTYDLPEERIARYPLPERDLSKLLVYKNSQIEEHRFLELPHQLPANSLLIFNETKVIRARLFFQNQNQKQIEVFCLEPTAEIGTPFQGLIKKREVRWWCMVGHLKSWKEESLQLHIGELQLSAKKVGRKAALVEIEFSWQPNDWTFAQVLEQCGQLPIPPYLNRATEESDVTQYQTVYSKTEGSVAAPTAGLHFTERVFNALKAKGITFENLVLHVGAGTFQPVKAEKIAGHEMHAEFIEVDRQLLQVLIDRGNAPVIAVGTTSLRSLESLYWMGCKIVAGGKVSVADIEVQQWDPYSADLPALKKEEALQGLVQWMDQQGINRLVCKTSILIAPPYQLRVADGIVTNFHQPQSTLLLLVAAIIGKDWQQVYRYALDHDFRFLSYGDSSLLLK